MAWWLGGYVRRNRFGDYCDITRRRAMSPFFNYTFLVASLRVRKDQIIVNISCLVPLESSWAVQYDSKSISYLNEQKKDYWKKNSQKSCFGNQLHSRVQTADRILWYRFCTSVQRLIGNLCVLHNWSQHSACTIRGGSVSIQRRQHRVKRLDKKLSNARRPPVLPTSMSWFFI